MILHYKRAIRDILSNRFLNAVTMITIAMSILIVSAFYLFFVNAADVMNEWKKGIRIMAYLEPNIDSEKPADLAQQLKDINGVQEVKFISKEEAFDYLKTQMKRQRSLLEDLGENPLPDAFEIRMMASIQSMDKIEALAIHIESMDAVQEGEYGEKWLGRFSNFFSMFRFAGYALGGLFFMAAVFIVANTIRLVLYSRREEVEIMRLVGATDGFIKAPFYIEGVIQGALGGVFGLSLLFVTFLLVSSNVEQDFSISLFQFRFLSLGILVFIMLCSMLVGWMGSYLSLRQFLKG